MADKRMPDLRDTGRRYLEETQRPRLASPGMERYLPARRQGPGVLAVAAILAAALIGALAWLALGR
jgi:hypothetical protein